MGATAPGHSRWTGETATASAFSPWSRPSPAPAPGLLRAGKRFHAELRKLAEYEHACIVVEGSLRDLLEGGYPGGAHPNALLGSIVAIVVDFRVPVYFCGDRQTALQFVERYLERCARAINERILE